MSLAYQGGEKLQAKLAELAALCGKTVSLRVGFLEGSECGGANHPATKTGKTPKPTALMPAPQVAFWLEYGTSRMPARPFFRQMIDACSPNWGEELGKIAVAAHFDFDVAMKRMGVHIEDQLRASILSFWDPGLAQRTIDIKGFAKPLIDSGNLLRSVSSEVSV